LAVVVVVMRIKVTQELQEVLAAVVVAVAVPLLEDLQVQELQDKVTLAVLGTVLGQTMAVVAAGVLVQ
jgi:H+/gluconate symporter-like permease